jgi:hypothetical protein
MPNAASISTPQLVKVQTLWSQYARRSLDVLPTSGVFARENDRLQRLAFIEGVVRRKINSTKELSSPEAIRVISALNQTLGLAAHQRRSREAETLREPTDAVQTAAAACRSPEVTISPASSEPTSGWAGTRNDSTPG